MKGLVFCFIILALAVEVTRCDDARIPRDEHYLMMQETARHEMFRLMSFIPIEFGPNSPPVLIPMDRRKFPPMVLSMILAGCDAYEFECTYLSRADIESQLRSALKHIVLFTQAELDAASRGLPAHVKVLSESTGGAFEIKWKK